MKNYLIIIATLIISLTSCSKEDDILIDEPTVTPQLCVKRTVDYSGFNNLERIISEYNYDGIVLLNWKETRIRPNSSTTTTYTNIYTGEDITSMIVSRLDDNVETETYYDFEYDSLGRLTKRFVDGSLEFTYVYTGYIVEKYDSNNILVGEQTYDLDYNLIGSKSKRASDSSWTYIAETTHDNKNMPFKNVSTWYPLSGYRYISPNNTTSNYYVVGGLSSPSGSTMSMNITYDINEFPTYIETTYGDPQYSKTETLEYNN